MFYLARTTQEGNATLADFPDCPGCQTFSRPPEEITTVAAEALHGWLESMLDSAGAIPRPRQKLTLRKGEQQIAVPVDTMLGARLTLRWVRDDAHVTQAELARRMGVTPQAVSKLERHAGTASVETLSRYVAALGESLELQIVPAPPRANPGRVARSREKHRHRR
jgi:antitoxin HicB